MKHTITRYVSRVAYARNGNTHAPTIEYFYSTIIGTHRTLKAAKTALTEEFGKCEFEILNTEKTNEIHALYPLAKHPK